MFLKKWWLEFMTKDGRRWSGWINTKAESREDFPKFIKGYFYTEKDEEGCHGKFKLNTGETGYVVVNKMCPPEYLPKDFSSNEAERYFQSNNALSKWERFDMNIEDCLNLDKTYTIKI